MAKHISTKSLIALTSAASLGILAGCSNGTTYGTGVSQESQLVSDLGGMLLLGSSKKKKRINYSSRPKLVKAPTNETLPSPAATVDSDSAYFPTDPEEARVARLAKLGKLNKNNERIGVYTPVLLDDAPRTASENNSSIDPEVEKNYPADVALRKRRRGHKERLARVKEIRSLGGGVGPRKYLTQPPVEYRTPADSAEQGVLGERVVELNKEKKSNIFDVFKKKKKKKK